MDTATHFAMGIGLFGLAHLDPLFHPNLKPPRQYWSEQS